MECVRVETLDSGIAKVYLNRPQVMNAINASLRHELEEVLKELAEDDGIRVVIITGAEAQGKRKAFSSGDDLRELEFDINSPDVLSEYYKSVDNVMRLFNFIDDYPKPVIAMVNGICMGGGLELALCCDFIFASESAVFAFPEAGIGFIPGWGGTQRLSKRIGESKAKMLIYTSDILDGKRAAELGLVDFLTTDSELEQKTVEFAMKIAEKSPLVIKMAKIAIERGMESSLRSGLYYEVLSLMVSLKTEDLREGFSAFLERRKPEFMGR
ncbi:enoyl-CoA hydratase-related protein [Geoglobus acetivorans]|uniref:Enoyl-CoA hydratase/isomerase family protein n=1 Tax=Geoglobus acetivorans TaxID=565033 RepID=A0ABZ3H4E2_GEOAI|nr:enoyl-CoA hydratase/isomerase family protein [Geoglobus acetivorans]